MRPPGLPEPTPRSEAERAQEVLALFELLEACWEHIIELEDAWMRGAITEHDDKGGTRSNRNTALRVRLNERLEVKP